MLNWFKKDKTKDYRSRIKKSFPNKLEKDLEIVLDIIPLENNQVELNDGNIHKVENLIYDYFKDIKLDNENLSIPYRVYFNEPNQVKENTLTDIQKAILNCIYLKHHNGFIRQKRLEQLGKNHQYWTTPYTFQLLGEYVFEILEVLDEQLDDNKLENYKRFAIENSKYYQQTESRMISYWNEYYRSRFPKLKNYVGRIIFDQIKTKEIGKRQDEIIEVGIDKNERLFIRPKTERFTLIYRTATEVHWDEKELFLYSPKPREWSYLDWYRHIIDVADKECNTKLVLTHRTIWTNIENELKKQIIENRKATA
jgi:hypothetical protein